MTWAGVVAILAAWLLALPALAGLGWLIERAERWCGK
jgi:hypothetical protein